MSDKDIPLIQTDNIYRLSDEQRQVAESHIGHDPADHICEACLDPWEDWCWAKKNGLDEPVPSGPNPSPADHRSETDCKCECHHIFWECELSKSALKNDGKPLVQLADAEEEQKEDGIKISGSQAVMDKLQELLGDETEGVLEELKREVRKNR